MYRPHVAILLMCVSRNTRRVYFPGLTGSQRTPGFWGVTSLLTSSLIALCLYGVKLLFCLIGLKEGLTFSLWVITAWSIPPISSYFQANTSIFCFKKRMRRSLMSSASLDPM